MSDIVDRLRGPMPSVLAMRDGAIEIELLRQRVKELEGYKEKYLLLSKQTVRAEERVEELEAELEEANRAIHSGEPVAWMYETDGYFHFQRARSIAPGYKETPLYLLPAIPDKWQLVPKELTDAMVDKGIDAYQDAWNNKDRGRFNAEQQLRAAYDAMLAAAPKYGEKG